MTDLTKQQIETGTRFFETPHVENGNPIASEMVKTGIPFLASIEKIGATNTTPEVVNALNEAKTSLRESFLWAKAALGYAIKGGIGNST